MGRPRRDDQHVVLDRVATALASRRDLRPWTLAEIAPAAGLSPAGLIKRFGSRKGVLLALSRRWIQQIPTEPQGDGLAVELELRMWVTDRFGPTDAQSTARGLTQLIDDLVDDDLLELLAEGWNRERRYLAALLRASQLTGITDPQRCAGILFDALNGAMLRRATDHDHDPVIVNLETLLEMWA